MKKVARKRPDQLRLAVGLLYLSLALSMVLGWIQFQHFAFSNMAQMVGYGVSLLVLAVLIEGIAAGRNWARFGYLAMLALGLPVFVYGLVNLHASQAYWTMLLGIAPWLMSFAATWLVFLSAGRAWFAPASDVLPARSRVVQTAMASLAVLLGVSMLGMLCFPPYKTENLMSNLSMGNTVSFSEGFIASRVAYLFGSPQRGDVAVYRRSYHGRSRTYVARVVGLPGETVQMREHQLFINGTPVALRPLAPVNPYAPGGGRLDEHSYIETLPNGVSYQIYDTRRDAGQGNTAPVTLSAGHYFVLGDNRNVADDSRNREQVGEVGSGDFVGKALIIYDAIWRPSVGRRIH